jgi:ribonucleotide monophosphatase NagD (HAD superfamily)
MTGYCMRNILFSMYAHRKGDTLIPGVPAVIQSLRELGKTIFFVTNSSAKSRRGFLQKFTTLGLDVKAEG